MEHLEQIGDANLILASSVVTGLEFGVFAQQSAFCLRSAAMEFWRAAPNGKVALWLLAFSVALPGAQWLLLSGTLQTENIRQLNGQGSLSGAIIGGLLFGFGMMLTRGCAVGAGVTD